MPTSHTTRARTFRSAISFSLFGEFFGLEHWVRTAATTSTCAAPQQIAQTAQVANQQGAVQFNPTVDYIDFSGSSLSVGTENAPATVTATCDQTDISC